MRRENEAITLALVHRPRLSPHTTGREHGATGWGEKRQNTATLFITGAAVRSGCRGVALTRMFCTPASMAAVLQNTSGPVFGILPPGLATGRRFVERHAVAVQQNISCPAVGGSEAQPYDLVRYVYFLSGFGW